MKTRAKQYFEVFVTSSGTHFGFVRAAGKMLTEEAKLDVEAFFKLHEERVRIYKKLER